VELCAEWLAAGIAAAQLLVTRLAEVLPGARAPEDSSLPAGWADWLNADLPLPAGATPWAEALACTAAPPTVDVGADDLALLPYTSGTTGKPKGVQRDVGGYAVALATSMDYIFGGKAGETYFSTSDIGW
ncbi:AMP-binding protein, partial [Klebsiella quasipneumoniae]|uniref:AMP-binding protein n=1 Tax=Klebsiella quasipneumoniae TaxID=1463165 RepID=UPI00272FF7B3